MLGLAAGGFAPLVAAACRPAGAAQLVEVHVDPGCGCCRVWADIVRQSGRFEVTVIESADVWALKDRVGVPAELRSCHTALIGDHAVEGHVPVEDMLRLLDRRPRGVIGLAVPGMPRGSPGMEMPDGSRDAFDVLAFDRAGASTVFASYPASA